MLRPATPADRPFLEQVYADSRARELSVTNWSDAEKAKFCQDQFATQDKHYRLNYPTCEFLVIENDGQLIGRLYRDLWEKEIRVVDIALLTTTRGQGIGGQIMSQIMAEAEASNLMVSIHVERSNPAMSLYSRLGFQTAEEGEVYDFLVWKAPAT